jgi:signal transduction histidine kinase
MTELSQLLAVLAHEMRTPIAAILGYQELLVEGIYGKVDERGKEPLDRIAYSARQLLHLIDGVQEISDPGAKLNRQRDPFEAAAVLRASVAAARADATGRGIQINADVPDSLPVICADSDRFGRAIDLALAAAIKASPGATLALTAAVHDRELRVIIAGTGLSAERDDPAVLQQIPQDAELTGPGLRLAIARHIAREMHGGLELQAVASGTTLTLRFAID